MNVLEFLKEIGPAPPAPVYLFCPYKRPKARTPSFEPFLAERAVNRLVETYVDPSTKDLCFSVFYADEVDPAEIVSVAETFPFLAERRVVLVRNAEVFRSETPTEPLLRYLESPCPTTVLLLVAATVDQRLKFYKTCDKVGQIVECPELKERELRQWVESEVKATGKTIEPAAVRELIARAGTRLSDVNNALRLVTGYVGETHRVSEEDVIAACADVAEEPIWALTDAIATSNPDKAIRTLRELIDLGKNEFEIMGSVNWLLKSAYAVARDGVNSPRLSPFVAKKAAPLARKLGVDKLCGAFGLCMETEVLLRSTGVDRALALELLILKLAVPRRQSGVGRS